VTYRETEEKARQPETTKCNCTHTPQNRPRNAIRSQLKNPQATHEAQSRPEPPQSKAGQDPASWSGQQLAWRCTHSTDTGSRCPANGNAKLPERPLDESGPRNARPTSLHRLVSQNAKQQQGRGSKASKDSTDIGTKGRAEDTRQYARPLEASRAAAANPGERVVPPAKETATGG
jgi:hypothetical protein